MHRRSQRSLACPICGHEAGSLFSCLDRRQGQELTQARVPHAYAADEGIFDEGDEALAAYCVRSGRVKLFRRTLNGSEVVVGFRSSGAVFGLRAAILGIPYSTSAKTLEPSIICSIPRGVLLNLLEESSALGVAMLRQMARDSRASEDQLVSRSVQDVRQRTARLLTSLAQESGMPSRGAGGALISMSRESLALIVGTTRETLSRTLHEFAHHGILELGPHDLRILDLEALKSRANQ